MIAIIFKSIHLHPILLHLQFVLSNYQFLINYLFVIFLINLPYYQSYNSSKYITLYEINQI
jgi:hypothetical protein